MGEPVEIRSVRPGDFEAWADLQSQRYSELEHNPELGLCTEVAEPSRSDYADFFAGLQAGIHEGRMICNVADEGGRLIGHASIFPVSDHREKRHIGSLGMVVRPEYRGKGVGSELLAKTLEDSRGKFEIIELSVTATNEVAIRLYRQHGFLERGRLPRSFKRDSLYLDELVMSRFVVPLPTGGG
jgi:ribosomal protein S18 acetylase RimI-like enzyme